MQPNLDFIAKVNDGYVEIVDENGKKYEIDPWLAGIVTAIVMDGHAVSEAIQIIKAGLTNPEIVKEIT